MLTQDCTMALVKDRNKQNRLFRVIGKLTVQALETDDIGPRHDADWYIKTRNRINRRYQRVIASA